MQALRPPLRSEDLTVLLPDLKSLEKILPGLAQAVGFASKLPPSDARESPSETRSSEDSSRKDTR
jgi:hypothetical protein